MKQAKRVRKQFILPVKKVRQAKRILAAKTETEAVERVLDLVIADEEIRKLLSSMKRSCNIEDVYGCLSR